MSGRSKPISAAHRPSSSTSSSSSSTTNNTNTLSQTPLIVGIVLVGVSILCGYFGSNYFDSHLAQILHNRGVTNSSAFSTKNDLPSTNTTTNDDNKDDSLPSYPPTIPSFTNTTTTATYIVSSVIPLHSSADERDYEWIRLSSGMEILLISDPGCTKSAVSVDIHRGSLSDTIPGLAHLLEHMLFLGTKKFAQENDFSSFLNAHGGGSNAYTDLEHTNYFFHVDSSALEGGLDRFAQFFIAPLMNSSSLSREMHAVDSEHKKNINSDNWRLYQLLKESASSSSSFHSFSTGNYETLNLPQTRLALLAFHNVHYLAANIRACIVAKESLNILRNWSLTYLQDVRTTSTLNNDAVDDTSSLNPALLPTDTIAELTKVINEVNAAYERSIGSTEPQKVFPLEAGIYRERLLTYRPIETGHTLTIFYPLWSFDSNNQELQYIPGSSFISSLIGDESQGSLLSLLRSQGLVETIYSGIEVDIQGFTLMSITIELSPLAITKIMAEEEEEESNTNDEQNTTAAAHMKRNLEIPEEHIIAMDESSESFLRKEDAKYGTTQEDRKMVEENTVTDKRKAKALCQLVTTVMDTTNRYLDILDEQITRSTRYGTEKLSQEGINDILYEIGLSSEELNQPLHRYDRSSVPNPSSMRPPRVLRNKQTNEIIAWPIDNNNGDSAYNLWQEYATLAEIEFQFPKHADEESTASTMSRAMHTSSPELILNSPKVRVWQPTHVLRLIRAMVPSRSFAILSSSVLPIGKVIEHSLTEPIYGTLYGSLPYSYIHSMVQDTHITTMHEFLIPADMLSTALSFPPPNPYIPNGLTVVNHDAYKHVVNIPPVPVSRTVDTVNNRTAEEIWFNTRIDPILVPLQLPLNALYTTMINQRTLNNNNDNNDEFKSRMKELYKAPTILSWWTPIPYFNWPKTFISIELLSLYARSSATASILTSLYTSIATEMINEELYQVLKAGSSISLSSSSFGPGIVLHIHGYSDSIHRILRETILSKLLNPSLQGDRITAHIALLVDGIRNRMYDQPYQRAGYYYSRISRSIRWSDEDLLRTAYTLAGFNITTDTDDHPSFVVNDKDGLTKVLQTHIYRLFSGIETVQSLVSGNEQVTETENLIMSVMANVFPLILQGHEYEMDTIGTNTEQFDTTISYNQVATIPEGSYVYQAKASNPEDPNSAVIICYQFGYGEDCQRLNDKNTLFPAWLLEDITNSSANRSDPDIDSIDKSTETILRQWSCAKRKAVFTVLGSLIREPAFDSLRTQQQLGYIVSAGSKTVVVANTPPSSNPPWEWTMNKNNNNNNEDVIDTVHTLCTTRDSSIRCRTVQQLRMVQNPNNDNTGTVINYEMNPVSVPIIGDTMLTLIVLVQGAVQPAHILDERASKFMQSELEIFLQTFSEKDFQSLVQSLRSELKERPTSPSDIHYSLWNDVTSRNFMFRRDIVDDQELASLQLDDIRLLYHYIVHRQVRRISVEVYGASIEPSPPQAFATAATIKDIAL